MDARPQRLRTMRTINDENAAPDGPLPRTIHHRNKSSPALTSLTSAAGLKAAAKRTAFGDVSNLVGSTRVVKDDSGIPVKTGAYGNAKISQVLNEKKSAAFLRPAQRPLSVSSLKSLLTGSNNAIQQPVAPVETVASEQAPNTRKTLSKRATTIFKDAVLDTVQEIDSTEPQKPSLPADSQPKPSILEAQVDVSEVDSRLCLPAPITTTRAEPVKQDQSHDTNVQCLNYSEPLLNIPPAEARLNISTEAGSYLPVNSSINPTIPTLKSESQYPGANEQATIPPLTTAEVISLPSTQVDATPAIHQTFQSGMQLPTQMQQEEYWDEEDEDNYEEEGYVTARSFRSRGDNTTGGATTILVPRLNQRVRREIEAAKKLVEATRTFEEIEDESFDTSMVAEYGDEIFEYMRQLEIKMSPNPHYMDNQHEIQWSMRTVLMDWLVQVHHRFNLLPETLFLCVNYIDRFLSSKVVSLGKLQLVGATAIFIAAKYEEINCPSVQEIVYMVDGGYSMDEILKAERFMLTMLQFELGWPGPMSFLRRISKADDYDLETRTLAKYFLEVTLMDERFIGSPPSFTAAASHCLARMMLRKGSWSAHHVYYSGYTWSQLRPIVQLLVDCCEDPRKHHSAVYNKYCDKRYKRASVFVENEIQRGFILPDSPVVKTATHTNTYAYYTNGSYRGI